MKVEYLVPSDIEIRRNHLYKNPAWRGVRDNNPSGYQYTIYTTKNLLELKMARRVLIDGNILENNWADAQSGYGVLFTVKNQEGDFADTPENESDFWSTVEDITFTNNILRNSASGILISGRDYSNQSDKTRRILVENNLFDNIGAFDGQGTFLLIDGTNNVSRGAPDTGAEHITINHNTIFHTGTIINASDQFTANPDTYINHPGFVFTNNISRKNQYGIKGGGASEGTNTINSYFRAEGSFPAGKFKRNVIASPTGSLSYYPADNCYGLLESAFNNEFESYAGGYRLKTDSYSKSCRGTDGKDVGYNVDLLNVAINRDNRGRRNAIDTQQFFVYMQYKDFFDRTPARGEVNMWAHVMQQPDCPVAVMCYDRIYIAGKAFFQSEEFQQKGYFTYRFYPVSFGRVNGKFVRPTYANFLADSQFMSTTDDAKKLAFATAFTQRPEFSQIYGSLSNADYVTTLLARIELPNHQQRDGWIAALNNATKSRSQVLMELVESSEVKNGEQFNRAWVSMQYHVYLRRDVDEGGYDAWLGVLNANPGNWRVMTQGFIDSTEYRARFGTP